MSPVWGWPCRRRCPPPIGPLDRQQPLLCAFIKWSGLRLLQPVLAQHLEAGRPLRVLNTVYLGATARHYCLHPKA